MRRSQTTMTQLTILPNFLFFAMTQPLSTCTTSETPLSVLCLKRSTNSAKPFSNLSGLNLEATVAISLPTEGDQHSSPDSIFEATSSSLLYLHSSGTNSFGPPELKTTGMHPAPIPSTIEIPKCSRGAG